MGIVKKWNLWSFEVGTVSLNLFRLQQNVPMSFFFFHFMWLLQWFVSCEELHPVGSMTSSHTLKSYMSGKLETVNYLFVRV